MRNNIFIAEANRQSFTWDNEPERWSYTEDGGLFVLAPAKADYYQDPAGKHIVSSAPFLHRPAGSSFELTTRLGAEMKHQYDSGCLMVLADDRNWAKLCFEHNGRYATIVSVVTQDGVSDDCNSMRVDIDKPYLRIARAGACITFHYSLDGERWEQVRYFGMKLPDACRVGVVAQSPQGTGCAVEFDFLTLTEPADE
ncbi:DUF1349 domain-containing protein [Paenibacillus sacheonensis]|uniref:DUF1349 domain-containing protein n=1 Tax=Paenibacillus sacheonensis TaxID=742054 RepID=A0A7X4YU03_9BACL|nr:regulation of enolase protein 1 (concanavalin A-like superfamily) [Paenibacillus sacheonensis]NBC71526.1 DUF1349 domain-containing protein [Paenibacillus sacheonensis]